MLLCRTRVLSRFSLCYSMYELLWFFFFFFKQKTAYEMRISDWSSDVCSSDLFAIALFPTMVAIELMTNIAVFGGLLLLLLPGLYLVGRLAVVAPAAADRAIYNPLEAIRASRSEEPRLNSSH